MRLTNLTPHTINIQTGTGVIAVPPSGDIARVRAGYEETGSLSTEQGPVSAFCATFGVVDGLPEPTPDTAYIVSGMVMSALAGSRTDCASPATGHPDCVRDEHGRIESVPGLIFAGELPAEQDATEMVSATQIALAEDTRWRPNTTKSPRWAAAAKDLIEISARALGRSGTHRAAADVAAGHDSYMPNGLDPETVLVTIHNHRNGNRPIYAAFVAAEGWSWFRGTHFGRQSSFQRIDVLDAAQRAVSLARQNRWPRA